MVQSEFDAYWDLTYVKLGSIGHYCLERQRFIAPRTFDQAIDSLEKLQDKNEELATDSSLEGAIDILDKLNRQTNALDALEAKMELELLWPHPELN